MMATRARRAAILAAGIMAVCTTAAPLFATPQRQMKVYFLNTGVQTQAQGKLLLVANRAQTFFTIKVTGMTPGAYDLLLDGAVVDALTVRSDGEGKVSHGTRVNPRHGVTPLPYDPRGGDLSIQAAGVDMLMASVPATAAEAQQKIQIRTDLTNMGVQTGATARATLVSRFGRIQFEVEMESALPGTYDLMVDGVKVAQIEADATGFGEVEFDSRPSSDDGDDDSLDLLLTFDPRGRAISIMQGTASLFAEMFPLQ